MFESLGVTEQTLTIYRTLLQHPQLLQKSDGELQTALATSGAITEAEAVRELVRLRDLGLIVPRWNIADQEYPIDPAVGFERLAARQRERIDGLAETLKNDETNAKGFTADYHEFLAQKTARQVELFEGSEAAYQRMQKFQPQKLCWGMLPASGVRTHELEDSPDRPFLERGIDARYLLTEAHLKTPGAREYALWSMGYGAKVRTVPSLPMKLVIFDDAVVLGIDPADPSVGAVVHHSVAVVNLAREYYESYWRRADDPFADEQRDDDGISSMEAELLQLLVQGATDEQAGASGRFELGVRAAQRGWVR
ncbi:hypothetical protein [Kribbella ginsengisoli]|uniref:Uncharacterized protein n=1 Tax=Kribbella ginsengisoli TaxID=363865 RepID=A0ABP6XYQ4_9ACTN